VQQSPVHAPQRHQDVSVSIMPDNKAIFFGGPLSDARLQKARLLHAPQCMQLQAQNLHPKFIVLQPSEPAQSALLVQDEKHALVVCPLLVPFSSLPWARNNHLLNMHISFLGHLAEHMVTRKRMCTFSL
jgi:hypothetical protein